MPFGGEKRLENIGERLRVHAATIVADRQHHVIAGDESRIGGAVFLIERDATRFNGHPASAVADGVAGVHAEIGEQLIDLRRVDQHRFERPAGFPPQVDILADQAPQHLEHGFDGFVQVENLGRHGLLAGKGEQLAREIGRAPSGILDLIEVGLQRLSLG